MANTDRMYTDKAGRMFMPMNVEGGSWNENFMTTKKLVALVGSIAITIIIIVWLNSRMSGLSAYILILGGWIVMFQYIMRYVIFEERFYYRMYKELKQSEITTPEIFWDIVSVKETDEGVILTYADGKIGALIKLERDTITGRTRDFKEVHYDALSEFYRGLTELSLSFIQMNIMERAGNDPRLAELDKLTAKSDNTNICKLAEMQIGYIKNITHSTLYESDYVLVYTSDMSRIDTLISETVDVIYRLMEGAFIGYSVLSAREIIELNKEQYGVKYFNFTEATLAMYKNMSGSSKKPIQIHTIHFENGESQRIGNTELNVINRITSEVSNGSLEIYNVAIKDALGSLNNKDKFSGVDFDSLDDIKYADDKNTVTGLNKIKSNIKNKKVDIEENVNNELEDFDIFDGLVFEDTLDDTLENKSDNSSVKNQRLEIKKGESDKVVVDDEDIIDF